MHYSQSHQVRKKLCSAISNSGAMHAARIGRNTRVAKKWRIIRKTCVCIVNCEKVYYLFRVGSIMNMYIYCCYRLLWCSNFLSRKRRKGGKEKTKNKVKKIVFSLLVVSDHYFPVWYLLTTSNKKTIKWLPCNVINYPCAVVPENISFLCIKNFFPHWIQLVSIRMRIFHIIIQFFFYAVCILCQNVLLLQCMKGLQTKSFYIQTGWPRSISWKSEWKYTIYWVGLRLFSSKKKERIPMLRLEEDISVVCK